MNFLSSVFIKQNWKYLFLNHLPGFEKQYSKKTKSKLRNFTVVKSSNKSLELLSTICFCGERK